MGELILCSQQLAAMPYYIENVSLNVYSLDELCYYIRNNICLLDADFMDDELCDWVENEQHLPDIAQNLRNIKAGGGVLSEFTGCLMSACGYCTKEEQKQIRNTLQEMEHKSAFECGKIKADRFLENRKYVSSIAEYRKLLQSCETEMPQMVGHHLTKKIKEDPRFEGLPVVIFSSLVNDEMKRKGEALGVDAQLSKPEIGRLVHQLDLLLK